MNENYKKIKKKREINISNIACSMCDPISKPNSETIKFPKLSSVWLWSHAVIRYCSHKKGSKEKCIT